MTGLTSKRESAIRPDGTRRLRAYAENAHKLRALGVCLLAIWMLAGCGEAGTIYIVNDLQIPVSVESCAQAPHLNWSDFEHGRCSTAERLRVRRQSCLTRAAFRADGTDGRDRRPKDQQE